MEGFWGQIGLRFAFVRPAARKKSPKEATSMCGERNTCLSFQQPECQSMRYLSLSANAVRQVIVDKSCRLQVGVTNRAAEEFESPFFHVFAHGVGFGR